MKLVHYFLLFSLTISTQQLSFRGRESAHLQKKVKTRTEIQQVLRKSGVAIIFFASVQCKTCASAFQELALQAMIQNIPLLTTSNSFLQARELFQLYRVEEFPTILVLKDTPQKVIFAATGYSSSAINQAAEVAVKNRR